MPDGTTARRAIKRGVGAAVLLTFPAVAALAFATPAVREPALRVLRTVSSDLVLSREGDLRLAVTTTEGVRRGDPAFLVADDGTSRPVAHVVAMEEGVLVLRFEPGEDAQGPWRAEVLPKGRTARAVLALAVPDAVARRLGEDLLARARRTWDDVLAPDAAARLPAFFARIDPERDERTRRVLETVGAGVFERLEPLGRDLADHVTTALDERFDFLDRMGLLWRFVRGDAKGLKRHLMPAAEEAATAWWGTHRAEVLAAIGQGLRANAPEVEAWVRDRVLEAAREELARPLLDAHGERLEAEARAWLARVVEEVAVAPRGGFRRRFAAVLRHHLLDKDDALVLLERAP